MSEYFSSGTNPMWHSNVAFHTSKAGVTEAAEDLLDRVKSKRKVCQTPDNVASLLLIRVGLI